ncbi:MAG: S41 family peptidase [Fimbriimonadaceae bacterium]|nr:S41 family peptidase [Fimbriimonadaceae bacterium]
MTCFRRILPILLAALSAPLWAQPITAEQKASVLAGIQETISQRAFVPGADFSKWSEFLAARQAELDKADTVPAFTTEVNRALNSFGFSHIRLLSPRAASRRGQTSTVGLGVSVRRVEDGLQVSAVAGGSPASQAEITPGTTILKVDGQPAREPAQLMGEEGVAVVLTVRRPDGTTADVPSTFRRFSTVRQETLTWVDSETAVLRVFTFSAGYGRQNLEKLIGEAAKAKRLVLDLRSNGGGAVNNLNHLLSLLLPDRTEYGTFISRTTYDRFVEANPEMEPTLVNIAEKTTRRAATRKREVEPFAGKIAVLTNRGSASASEITAAALREQAGAILVGTPTRGAVLASTFRGLNEGFSIQYPVSDYITVKGMRLEGNPLQPDITVTGNATAESDPVLDAAVKALKEAAGVPTFGLFSHLDRRN